MSLIINSSRTTEFDAFIAAAHPEAAAPWPAPRAGCGRREEWGWAAGPRVPVGPHPWHGRLGTGSGADAQKRASRARCRPQAAPRAAARRTGPPTLIPIPALSAGGSRALVAGASVIKSITATAARLGRSCYLSSTWAVPLEKAHFTEAL